MTTLLWCIAGFFFGNSVVQFIINRSIRKHRDLISKDFNDYIEYTEKKNEIVMEKTVPCPCCHKIPEIRLYDDNIFIYDYYKYEIRLFCANTACLISSRDFSIKINISPDKTLQKHMANSLIKKWNKRILSFDNKEE